MRNIKLLSKRKVERIQDQPRPEGIDEKRSHTRQTYNQQLAKLCRSPRLSLHKPPFSFCQTSCGDNKKDNQPERPGTVSIYPETKKRRNQPQRGIFVTTKTLQDDQQNY